MLLCAVLLALVAVTISPVQAEMHWDYMVFTQHWPATLCGFRKCSNPPQNEEFTIHGLWPNKFPSVQPEACPRAPDFNPSLLDPIMEDLLVAWPDHYGAPAYSFWKHEWYKHGKCAIEDNLIRNELGYFNVSMFLKTKTPVFEILKAAGIEPDNKRILEYSDVAQKIHEGLGVMPTFSCLKKKKKTAQLLEVRVCYSPTLELMDCVTGQDFSNAMHCPSKFILPNI